VFGAVDPTASTERAQFYEREQKRSVQLAVVNEVARRAASILDMDQLLQEVITAVQQGFNYHNVLLAMLDETASELEVQAIAGGFEDLIPPDYRQAVGMGMIGWTAETGQPLLANDVRREPHYILGFLEEPLTKSELCVPLKLTGQVIGVLDVQDTRLNVFDETDLMTMVTLADQLAVAIERGRLYQEIQRRLEELTFLSRVGRTVTSSLDLEQILTTIMAETALTLGAEIGSILLLDEESGELVFEAAVGPRAEGMKGLRLSLGQGIAGWVAQEGQPLLVLNVREDPRFYPDIDEVTGFVTKSILSVPLKVKGKVIGVIEALNKAEGDFSQADVALLSSMAQTAAIAIENAQLFAETQRRFEEMTALYDVSLDVTARLEMPELLKSIVERAVTLLRADAGSIYLYDSEREELRMVIGYDYTEKYIGITLKPGEGIAGKVFQTGDPLIVDDYRAWEGRAAVFEADQPFTAVLEVPLKWQERVIGVLVITADVQRRTFNQDDVWLATLFAHQAAVAIENAHL